MAEVRWSKKAISQLEHAVTYIASEQSKAYAQIVLSKILSATSHLSDNPRMGAKEPLLEYRQKEYRYLVVWSYKIIYKVHENDNVLIARVFHTAQNPSKIRR